MLVTFKPSNVRQTVTGPSNLYGTGECVRDDTREGLVWVGVYAAALLAAFGLASWALDMPILSELLPGLVRMSVPTSIGFFGCVLAMLLAHGRLSAWAHAGIARKVALWGVVAIAVYALIALVVFRTSGVAWFERPFRNLFGVELGLVAPATAFCFLLLGSALLTPERMGRTYSALIGVGLGVTGAAIIGYIYSVEALYGVLPFAAMSLPTALCFLFLFLSAMAARPQAGWIRQIFAGDSGGTSARRLLPVAIVVPLFVAGYVMTAVRNGVFEHPFGFALVAVISMGVLVGVVLLESASIGRREGLLLAEMALREKAEHRMANKQGRLALLNEITQAMIERQDSASLQQVVARRLVDRLPCDFAAVLTDDERSDEGRSGHFTVAHAAGLTDAVSAAFAAEGSSWMEAGSGLDEVCEGRLLHIPDAERDARRVGRLFHDVGFDRLIAVPMHAEERLIGVLMVARRGGEAFTSTDCEFMSQLAQNLSVAAHQVALHQTLKSAYDEIRASQDVILRQERFRVVGQMASGIAHNINNAVTPLSLQTDKMLETADATPAPMRSYLEMARHVTDDVIAIVSRMRDLYRPNNARESNAATDLNTIVGEVVELTRSRWSDMAHMRGVDIQLVQDLEAGGLLAAAPATELREALINLVFNAVDAMPDGGEIRITTCRDQGEAEPFAVLEVADTGSGMTAEAIERCLEPFYTSKGEHGTGLGLLMVQAVVQRHDGTLTIESEPGRGSTFRLGFPVAHEAVEPVATEPPQRSGPLRIMVVDDDASVLETLQDMLELDGHAVVAARSGEEALAKLADASTADQGVDIVFTDLGMPNMDGEEVARRIKAIAPDLPVVLLSGWGRRKSDGEASLIDRVMSKPPRLADLRKTLTELGGGSRA
ncbi:MAG: ATP-binding protein [Hyphomonadaceae bacterium]